MLEGRPSKTAAALLLLCAVLAGGCGSSSNSSSTTSTQTASAATTAAAIAGGELSRLNQALPVSTARIPSASTNKVVERAYLTVLFDDAQNVWRRDFATAHVTYKPARLVVYWSKIESACGKTDDSGPFYCPGDRTVYLDLRFFTLLVHTVGVHSVAQAYIVGHEVAHHVQKLLGIAGRVDAANQADPDGSNSRSVLVELEADCLSGVWGRSAYARAGLTVSELDDAVKTAEVIGDDYEAEAAGDVVDSSLWTHGSSQQRKYWLRTGFRNGRPVACDTFAK
jgi:uncharacterized protein